MYGAPPCLTEWLLLCVEDKRYCSRGLETLDQFTMLAGVRSGALSQEETNR